MNKRELVNHLLHLLRDALNEPDTFHLEGEELKGWLIESGIEEELGDMEYHDVRELCERIEYYMNH